MLFVDVAVGCFYGNDDNRNNDHDHIDYIDDYIDEKGDNKLILKMVSVLVLLGVRMLIVMLHSCCDNESDYNLGHDSIAAKYVRTLSGLFSPN